MSEQQACRARLAVRSEKRIRYTTTPRTLLRLRMIENRNARAYFIKMPNITIALETPV